MNKLFEPFIFIRPSLRRDVLWYTNVRLSVRLSIRPFHMSCSNLRTPWSIHFKFHRVIGIDGLMIYTLWRNFEFSFQSYGTLFIKLQAIFRNSRCKLRTPWPIHFKLRQLLELIVLWSVYFLVKFQFFIPELWDFIHQIVGDFS